MAGAAALPRIDGLLLENPSGPSVGSSLVAFGSRLLVQLAIFHVWFYFGPRGLATTKQNADRG